MFFEGFTLEHVAVSGGSIRLRRGGAVGSGHYLAEEAPEEVLQRMGRFFPA